MVNFCSCFNGSCVDVWFWVKQWIEYRTDFARPMMIISVVLLFLAVMIVLYVFPLQAKFDNKIKVQLRNAFLLSIKFFPTTILMMAILAVVLWMFYYFTVFAVFGFAFIGFGILGFILGYFMLKCFKPYLEISKKTESDEAFDDDESEEIRMCSQMKKQMMNQRKKRMMILRKILMIMPV